MTKRVTGQIKPLSLREMIRVCSHEPLKLWPDGMDVDTEFLAIHAFVETLRRSKEQAFIAVERNGNRTFKPGRFAAQIALGRWLDPELTSRFECSPQIKEFLGARYLFSVHEYARHPNELSRNKLMGERFNFVVDRVRERCTGKPFLDAMHTRRVNVMRNCATADAVIADVATRIRHPFVARFELAYESELHKQLFDRPGYLRGHLRHFFGSWRKHEGYIWKVGYNSVSGYHAHVVMFFDGDKVSWRDEYSLIYAHWRHTTGTNVGLIRDWTGEGRRTILGTGAGYWDSGMKVEKKKDLRRAVYYLIQKDEYFRPAFLFRTFAATVLRHGKSERTSANVSGRSLTSLRIEPNEALRARTTSSSDKKSRSR